MCWWWLLIACHAKNDSSTIKILTKPRQRQSERRGKEKKHSHARTFETFPLCSDLPVQNRVVVVFAAGENAGENAGGDAGTATHIWAPGTAILTWLFCDREIVKRVLSICGSFVESDGSSGVSYRRWPIEGGSAVEGGRSHKRIGGSGERPKIENWAHRKVWCAVALRTDQLWRIVKVQRANCQRQTRATPDWLIPSRDCRVQLKR